MTEMTEMTGMIAIGEFVEKMTVRAASKIEMVGNTGVLALQGAAEVAEAEVTDTGLRIGMTRRERKKSGKFMSFQDISIVRVLQGT